jgi:hypothetical protein
LFDRLEWQNDAGDLGGLAVPDEFDLALVVEEQEAISIWQRPVGFEEADDLLLFLLSETGHGIVPKEVQAGRGVAPGTRDHSELLCGGRHWGRRLMGAGDAAQWMALDAAGGGASAGEAKTEAAVLAPKKWHPCRVSTGVPSS